MNNKLRIIDNIKILEEHDNVAMACQLICDCGCNHFIIFHTGKVTKGIFAPYLIKKDKQIVIKAVCKDCGKSIIVFDSKIDGIKPIMCDTFEMINLDTIKSIEIFSFYRGSNPIVTPFICPVWAFFFLRHCFSSKK